MAIISFGVFFGSLDSDKFLLANWWFFQISEASTVTAGSIHHGASMAPPHPRIFFQLSCCRTREQRRRTLPYWDRLQTGRSWSKLPAISSLESEMKWRFRVITQKGVCLLLFSLPTARTPEQIHLLNDKGLSSESSNNPYTRCYLVFQGTLGCTPNNVPMVFIVFSRDSWGWKKPINTHEI